MHLSKLLGQWRWNVGLGKTFNLSYHMINSDCKSQSYAHLMVFNKMATKPRWPPKMPQKTIPDLDLHMPHLVWKFYGKSCFSFLRYGAATEKSGQKVQKTLKNGCQSKMATEICNKKYTFPSSPHVPSFVKVSWRKQFQFLRFGASIEKSGPKKNNTRSFFTGKL